MSELAPSEGQVLLLLVEGPDTLFQSKERFVDLSSIDLCLLVLVLHVGATFAARQVNEGNLGVDAIVVFKSHGHNGVGARGLSVGASLARGAVSHSDLQRLHDVLDSCALNFLDVCQRDLTTFILTTDNFSLFVEQVLQFTAINFIERQMKLQIGVGIE